MWGLTCFLMRTFSASCWQICRTPDGCIGEPGFFPGNNQSGGFRQRAQQSQQLGREHDLPGSLAFSFPHPNHHALAVDVGNLELEHFGAT